MGKAAQRSFWRRRAGHGTAAGLGLLMVAAALSACDALGLGKSAPDEFAVSRSAPLIVPPDYKLRPPEPGAPRPNETSVRDQAESVLLNDSGAAPAGDSAATRGELALIAQAGATDVAPDIRQIVDREFSSYASESDSFVDSLLFWQVTEPPGDVVDPAAEAQRLRENAATGAPVTEGETPTIQRREKALLEGIF